MRGEERGRGRRGGDGLAGNARGGRPHLSGFYCLMSCGARPGQVVLLCSQSSESEHRSYSCKVVVFVCFVYRLSLNDSPAQISSLR